MATSIRDAVEECLALNSIQLPGVRVSLSGQPGPIPRALESVFALCPRTSEPAEVLIEGTGVRRGEMRRAVPAWLLAEDLTRELANGAAVYSGPDGGLASVGVSRGSIFFACLSEDGKRIRVVGETGETTPPRGVVFSVLIPMLREVMLRRGGYLFHGAAVLFPDRTGVLLVGSTGSGKTTCSVSALTRGARLLGDDLAVVRRKGEAVELSGILKPLNIRPGTVKFFEELRRRLPSPPVGAAGDGRVSVAPQALFGKDCTVDRCELHLIYFLGSSTVGPSVRRLGVAEAIERLLLANAFSPRQRHSGRVIDGICGILDRVRVYELTMGEDPVFLGKWLQRYAPRHACGDGAV